MVTSPERGPGGSRFVGVIGALTQLSFAVQRVLEGIAADYGLSLIQARLVVMLLERRPTMSELANLLYLERSSTTGLVARAEAHGLVQRAREGSLTRATLTPHGREVAEQISQSVIERLDARSRSLSSEESGQLVQLAQRLLRSSQDV
jgi:DNA-binding MarR family transcriptional regulator